MNIVNLISKKQRGKALTETEINWFVHSVNNKSLADYQVSAFLMAVWFQGMNSKELFVSPKRWWNQERASTLTTTAS